MLDQQCADFEVRFCCPEEYHNPCASNNLICADNQHIVYRTYNDSYSECECACDEGYVTNTTQTRIGGKKDFLTELKDWSVRN